MPRTHKVISYDDRSMRIQGKKTLIISGEIHYARMPRAEWAAVLDESVACGLNTIATYVFWNWHEPQRDVYDFSGDRDLGFFLQLCAERNLNVILRAGPYCCAEWNFGGYPPYLRDEPGIVIRTWNEPYLRRVEKYFRHLIPEIRPFLASNGGPIILVQAENEYLNVSKRYGREGVRYLKWLAALTRELGVDVPLIMCEGGIDGVVETLNGFSLPEERVSGFRKSHPKLPLIWTEMWPSWYETWGFAQHRRKPQNIAFYILDWIAQGGSGWNYYMWFAGTNFGRTSMYLQATHYGFDAPLDEHGCPRASARYLAALHHLLASRSEILLGGKRTVSEVKPGIRRIEWRHKQGVLILEMDGATFAARLKDGSGKTLFDTEDTFRKTNKTFRAPAWSKELPIVGWEHWSEPAPGSRSDGTTAPRPVEQLLLTGDRSDYCWYSSKWNLRKSGAQKLKIPFCADILRVFVDGKLIGQTRPPFLENRGPTSIPGRGEKVRVANILELRQGRYEQCFEFEAEAGEHRLEILAASIGLIKGDWMVAGPMNTERRGIWQGVFLNGREVLNWTMHPSLVGENSAIAGRPETVVWNAGSAPAPCTWHHSKFTLPSRLLAGGTDFRLDASGLDKGMLFVNGNALGRHWLIIGHGYGADEHWQDTKKHGLYLEGEGEPTQRYYKIPSSWLKTSNHLIVFEEAALSPGALTIEARRGIRS